jgi:phytoene dehydrogenase-like protein
VSSPLIIGAGHNGLITAFYLARAGLKPIVLEARSMVGGAAVTEEIAPGHRCPTLAHSIGPLRPSIFADMQLARRVEVLRPDPRLVALSPAGRHLVLSTDVARSAESIRRHAAADADRYPEFCATLERLGAFILPLLERTPPSLDNPPPREIWDLLKTGRRFRKLGRSDGFRLLRWMPMAVADLVGEWFTGDLLQATVAARGIFGAAAGPWSGGTGAALLWNAAIDPVPGGSTIVVKGGPGALTAALADAARGAGATIRLDARVARVLVRDGKATGVVLDGGEEVPATAVISNADPRRTLLGLVGPIELDPGFVQRIRNYRMPGTVAKVNLTLGALPAFTGVADPGDLRGRIHIGPSLDYLEKAYDASKYGEISAEPYLDVTIPSLLDPSLCPPDRHVMSVYVQFAPYQLAGTDWTTARDQLATTVVRTLERYAPGIWNAIEHRLVLTPVDLEETYGLTRGHIHHGEQSIDQLFSMRPTLGWAQYRTPIDGLFLCGAGTHPGGAITGLSGRNAARVIAKALHRG